MKKYEDYFIGFASVMMIAALYTASYAMWRTQYPEQRVEMCDANEWNVQIADGALTTFYRPAIAVEQQLICCNTTIKVVDKD